MASAGGEGLDLAQEATNLKTVALGIVMIVFGTLLNAGAEGYVSNAVTKSIILGIGSTIISIGLISIGLEIILRRQLQRELIKLVGIQRSVSANQVVSVGQLSEIDWKDTLTEGTRYRLLFTDPEPILLQHFHIILSSAKSKSVFLDVYVPDPEANYMDALASLVNKQVEYLEGSINHTITTLESRWKLAQQNGEIKKGSKISIKPLLETPRYSVCAVDSRITAVFTSAIGYSPAESNYFTVFSGNMQSYPSNWYISQIDGSPAGGARYENEVI